MKFTFKRKYTCSFLIFLSLICLAVAFYFVAPRFINREQDFFNQVLLISIADIILITIFILGLYRVNYYLYHDHIEIRKSLKKTKIINYSDIKDFVEYPNDSVIFIFGKRPSFKLKCVIGNKVKKYRIRVAKHELFKLIMENENKIISTTKNK